MVPLYAARVSDLGPGDFVKVECIACGYDLLITGQRIATGARAASIHARARPGASVPLARMRCRRDLAKGKRTLQASLVSDRKDCPPTRGAVHFRLLSLRKY